MTRWRDRDPRVSGGVAYCTVCGMQLYLRYVVCIQYGMTSRNGLSLERVGDNISFLDKHESFSFMSVGPLPGPKSYLSG